MGLLGSAFGRGLAGAGEAAAKIANKWIDEELAQQRAQAFADIQRQSATNQRNDQFAHDNDPKNVRTRIATSDDVTRAAGVTARSEIPLNAAAARKVVIDAQGDTLYQDALAENADAETKRKAAAERNATKDAGQDKDYLAALKAIQKASETTDRTDYEGRNLDNAIKKMAVANAKHMVDLKKEFATATPERQQAIKDEMSILTGKDNDKFLPVPLKDESGNVTGYKIFDTKSGKWVDGEEKADPAKAWMDAQRAKLNGKDGKTTETAKTPPATEWRPDPDSPAGKRRALMDTARDARKTEAQNDQDVTAVKRANAEDQARPLLAAGDKRALYKFQQSPAFKDLGADTKAKISAMLLGQ